MESILFIAARSLTVIVSIQDTIISAGFNETISKEKCSGLILCLCPEIVYC